MTRAVGRYGRQVQLEQLADLLPHVDIRGAFDVWHAETGSSDVDAFITHLRATDVIEAAGFVAVHAAETLTGAATVNGLDTLPGDAAGGAGLATEVQGPLLERYELLGEVGGGAVGVVHVARDRELERKVAVKQLRPDIDLDSGPAVRRFLSEAQITAQLNHPNIVPVYGLALGDQAASYAMKLVDGRTLGEVIHAARSTRDDPQASRSQQVELLEIFIKVCDAVSFAHEKGVIHRDLKPSNIMVGPFGEVYVMDWGLARLYADEAAAASEGEANTETDPLSETLPPDFGTTVQDPTETVDGQLVGTPNYMSPEQAHGAMSALGPASDQYTLGLILYELVHLRRAYPETALDKVLHRSRTGDKATPVTPAPIELTAIIDKATALERTDRYADVQALAADLKRYMHGDETEVLPDNLSRKLRRWVIRNQKRAVLGVMTVVFLAIGLVAWSHVRERARVAEAKVAAQEAEAAVSGFVHDVAQRGQRLANHLLWYEGLTEGMVGAARHALLRGSGSVETYSWQAFKAGKAPAGSVHSAYYKRVISPDHGVTACAPGVAQADCDKDLGRLGTLRDHARQLFAAGPDGQAPLEDLEVLRKRILEHALPIEWAYVALESGVIFMFPGGFGHWDDNYDPRKRPWYRQGKAALKQTPPRRRVWSRPYVDLMGQGRVITCIQPLLDDRGGFMGVVALDLGFNTLIDEHLAMPKLDGFVASYLLDREGRIMVSSAARDAPFTPPQDTSVTDDGLDFGEFGQADVREAVKQGRSGSLTVDSPGGPQLIAWTRLQHIDWTFVVVADRGKVMQGVGSKR